MQDAYRLTKTTLLTLLAVGMSQMSASAQDSASAVESANPMIGTANLDVYAAWDSGIRGHGHAYPGATVPLEWSN
jgi:hypothetical protein